MSRNPKLIFYSVSLSMVKALRRTFPVSTLAGDDALESKFHEQSGPFVLVGTKVRCF